MNEQHATSRSSVPTWVILLVGVLALVVATAALTATLLARGTSPAFGPMMGSRGGTTGPAGMMGSFGRSIDGAQPGESGFVAGTVSSPRVVRVTAGPNDAFTPYSIRVARGETVTFEVTTMGPLVHEFMVGPADAVAADTDGTPEAADIGMMQTKSVTYTFVGDGPFAFACHETGHYEAGMRGAIVVVPGPS